MENVIMMINNAGDVFKLCLAQKENTSFTTCKDQSESPRNRYACYISYQWYFKRFIEVLNASSWKHFTTRVHSFTQIYLQYSNFGWFLERSRTCRRVFVTKTNHFT